MPEPRLRAGIWVAAYLARLQGLAIPAFVVRRGDETAGAVLVKLATLDGQARAFQRSFDPMTGQRTWMVLAEGEAAVEHGAAALKGAGTSPPVRPAPCSWSCSPCR